MTNPLSDAEAAKLFNSVSASLNDLDKLNELMATESISAAPAAEVEVVTQEVVETAPASGEQAVTDDGNKEEPTPVMEAPAPTAPAADEVEALKEKVKLMEHRIKSDDGRVAAYQRKAFDVEAQLAELKKNATPPSAAPAPESPRGDEDLELLRKADPALYRILMKREESYKNEVNALRNQLKQELAPVKQNMERAETSNEVTRLKEMVPNVGQVVQSDAFITYRDYVAPQAIRQLLTSRSADDVVHGLQIYSAWLQSENLGAQGSKSTATETNSTNVSALAQERERKLTTSVNVASPSAAPVKKELTEQEWFDQVFRDSLKRNEPRR